MQKPMNHLVLPGDSTLANGAVTEPSQTHRGAQVVVT